MLCFVILLNCGSHYTEEHCKRGMVSHIELLFLIFFILLMPCDDKNCTGDNDEPVGIKINLQNKQKQTVGPVIVKNLVFWGFFFA